MASDQNDGSLGRVIVTGGCGSLGHNIVALILDHYPKSDVAILDLHTDLNRIESPKTSYHEVDITKLDDIREVFQKVKPDVVIHTAAAVAVATRTVLPDSFLHKVNVDGTKNLLVAAKEVDVKAFVYTSSSSVVVGHAANIFRADESWPVLTGKDQPEYYTTTKALGEIAVLEANRSSPNFLTAAVRPASIFGEGDMIMLGRMLTQDGIKSRFQIGDNDNLFDFTYVKNVAHCHLLAADALLQTHALKTIPLDHERVDGEAFFVTNDSPIYFWDFFRQVIKAGGRNPDALNLASLWVLNTTLALTVASIAELVLGIFGKTPKLTRYIVKNTVMTRYFSVEKAKTRLRYEPLYTLEEGIQRGVADVLGRIDALAQKKTQ